jgi:hypothetical protein
MMRELDEGQLEAEVAPKAKRGHHREPSQHRDQHGHPRQLVRGVRPRALAPGRLRLDASIHTLEVLSGLETIGFELAGQIIWDEGLFSVGRSWYHWAHEPCVVVRRPGVPNLFTGERDQSTIWRAPSPKRIGGGRVSSTRRTTLPRSPCSCPRSPSATTPYQLPSPAPGQTPLPVSRRRFIERPFSSPCTMPTFRPIVISCSSAVPRF